jgi:precorrin-6B methylase 2
MEEYGMEKGSRDLTAPDTSGTRETVVPDSCQAENSIAHPTMDLRLFFRILRAYESWVTRVYLLIRFSIIRWIILDILSNLPEEGTVVNLGSGIGLFDIYCAHHRPRVRFIGIERDETRVRMSKAAAGRFGVSNVEFRQGDVAESLPDLRPDVVILLDLLHHLRPGDQDRVLGWIAAHLEPQGVLFVKDISIQKPWKVRFTKLWDDVMTRREPTFYFGAGDLRRRLAALGFVTSTFHLWDYIPFPHIIYVAHKQNGR